MKIHINGDVVRSEMDFHRELASALGVESFYGFNLDALWDLLSSSVERPVFLMWINAGVSRKYMGKSYFEIVDILERVKIQDERFGWNDKFTYKIDL
ncbi:barstar (barnase inhibitor) [Cupriavidus basilensis OR16]|uniref:Barstar (Barnase inhibitor) n=1 Tax=Cupriavidus basilensis OR16 TaxID=1127483 RepID=H1S4G9_9BURK|nr:barstar family protein [Cupriavidus basilensis]EHP42652.1 barstar (barnase inhibitor) [Cupriavidus basilensis OR16]